MRSLIRLTVASLVFACCCLTAIEVNADPLVITSGTIQGQGGNGLGTATYNFAGPGISVNAGFVDGFFFNCNCAPPMVNGFHGSFSSGGGTVILNGITYNVGFNGVLNTSSPPVVLPPATSLDDIIVTLPFTMTGTLIGCNDTPVNCQDQAFNITLTGQGFVTAHFRALVVGGSPLEIRDVTYNFQPASVPEPATLLLLGTGLAAVAARVGKRRRVSK